MRVALVLGASVGGIGAYVRDLAEHCVACGDEVVVAGPQPTEDHFAFSATGARFVPLKSLSRSPSKCLTTLRRVLAEADVVHSHGFKAAAMTNLARAGRRGPRHVVTLHNAILAAGLRARIAGWCVGRLAVRPADAVLGASADLVQRAKELGARRAELVPVPAPPLPEPARSPAEVRAELAVADDEFLLLAVGRLAPQKSLPLLLDAVAQLRDLPLRLVIAGEGPERAALAARIEGEKPPVTLLGHRADIADLLAAADVFVLSSRWEARALVVQEALRAAVPVVATAVGGIPDLVAGAARLVPWNDAAALAAAIRGVLTDPDLRDGLCAAGPVQAATWPAPADALAAARDRYTARNTPVTQGAVH
jgi:glycosyltransferase involved in cell wall biosynthesis